MKQSVQNKINNLKKRAKTGPVSDTASKSSSRIINDNLSRSIRTEKDANVFRKELSMAFKLAKK